MRTQAFKAWFGDWINDPKNSSKVVDENGEPLVVYHYSPKKFNVFDTSNKFHGGSYFTPSQQKAKRYGKNKYAVFLNV